MASFVLDVTLLGPMRVTVAVSAAFGEYCRVPTLIIFLPDWPAFRCSVSGLLCLQSSDSFVDDVAAPATPEFGRKGD